MTTSTILTAKVWYLTQSYPTEPIWFSRGLQTESQAFKPKHVPSLLRPKSSAGQKRSLTDPHTFLQSPPLPPRTDLPSLAPLTPLTPLSPNLTSAKSLQSVTEVFLNQNHSNQAGPSTPSSQVNENARELRQAKFETQRAALRLDPFHTFHPMLQPRNDNPGALAVMLLDRRGVLRLGSRAIPVDTGMKLIYVHTLPSGRHWPEAPLSPEIRLSSPFQTIHRSVFGVRQVMILPEPHASTHTTLPDFDSSSTGPPIISATEPPVTKRVGSLFSLRKRGKTVSIVQDQTSPQRPPDLPPLMINTERQTLPEPGTDEMSMRNERLFVAFNSPGVYEEWNVLLRSLSTPKSPSHIHRRLHITIWDVQDESRSSGRSDFCGYTIITPNDVLSDTKSGISNNGNSSVSHRNDLRQTRQVTADWAAKEEIAVTIELNDLHAARTTWQRANSAAASPFWGETFRFDDLPDTPSCSLKLYRTVRNKPVHFGSVTIPLVPSFAKPKDERYPILSVDDGAVGEILGARNTETLYHLSRQGQLSYCGDLLAKLCFSDGGLPSRLTPMCDMDVRNSEPSTLFRGYTPFSKLLESAMRLSAKEFLEKSIGPTIQRITGGRFVLRYTDHGTSDHTRLDSESVMYVLGLATSCLEDLYEHRTLMPDCLRRVFAHMFVTVKNRYTSQEMLHYKAVASFLFLRLIGPAIMRPHLFDLADGLQSAPAQAILTLLAKILKTMAFFSHKSVEMDHELSPFMEFITGHSSTMVDYIAGIATPLDGYIERPSGPTGQIIDERRQSSTRSLPVFTPAGYVDVNVNLALLFETLYERRRSVQTDEQNINTHTKDNLRRLDKVLQKVHDTATSLYSNDTGQPSLLRRC
ncbi:hypothetical protein TREMEDRAFT_63381 [Tremella mesenterica DSM 1558]|uniref:uncharacterized protein n=1 Tax=Tremella mesenterica (strain ATCC 24925 / CBS 8224 / DSM 1558 / NBRC 9311 / NRRL Y-6157 / RJB 2259-6 / UBC 559-6) TaxID=578456 RepID=UPI0003F494C8|nr:uncharacterized protein TREMEDRAFT_63381 [Tremella mesenterica DSM 1558]EIW68217.1 hypothetical protein TREMEDRAFT_63381 [Tremella mesenterica DSM 1558]